MHLAAVQLHISNSNIKIVNNSFEHFLWNLPNFFSDDVLFCLWIVFTDTVFQVPPQKIVGLRSWEQDNQELSVWREMSLSHGKLCLKYSRIRKEIRQIPQEMLNRVVGNFNVRVAAVLSYSAWNEHSINY